MSGTYWMEQPKYNDFLVFVSDPCWVIMCDSESYFTPDGDRIFVFTTVDLAEKFVEYRKMMFQQQLIARETSPAEIYRCIYQYMGQGGRKKILAEIDYDREHRLHKTVCVR